MTAPLDAIVALQTTLTELTAASERLNSIPDWMRELHEEHSQRKAEIDAVAMVGTEAERERREAEAAVSDAQEKHQQYQQQIGKVSTQREYGALLKEIDTVKSQIRTSEQKALEALERIEEAQQQLTVQEEGFSELDERYQTELAKWESEKPAVADLIKDLTGRCELLRSEVPRNTLTLFDRIYERYDGQAMARVHSIQIARGNTMWHCDACSYNVRPQTVVEIRNGGAVSQCEGCKRILFWQDEA